MKPSLHDMAGTASNPVTRQSNDSDTIRKAAAAVRSVILSRRYLAMVFTLGFAIRLCWILIFHPIPMSDFAFFFRSAESIARGYGYVTDHGFATSYFPIGYPFFLGSLFWVFGVSVTVAQMANLFLSVASLVLTYWIARDLFRSEIAGRISLLLLAIYPNNIAYTSLVGTEIFYLFLIFLGVTLLLPGISGKAGAHPLRLLSAGLVFGLATLVKVQTLLLPAILLVLLPKLSPRQKSLDNRVKRVAIVYVVLLAGLSPWIIRNYRLYNDIVLTNNGGLNLYIGNCPEATGTWIAVPWFDAVNSAMDEYKINKIAGREAVEYVKNHPWQTLALMPKKLIALFDNGDGMYWNTVGMRNESMPARNILRLLDQLNPIYESAIYILFIGSLAFGIWKRLRRGKGHAWPLLGIIVIIYFTDIYLVFYGVPRYSFPIIPWMMMYSAALLSSLVDPHPNNLSALI